MACLRACAIGLFSPLVAGLVAAAPAAGQILPTIEAPSIAPSGGFGAPGGSALSGGSAFGGVAGGRTGSASFPSANAGALGFPFSVGETPGVPTRGWSVTPSIAAEIIANDNIFATARNREADLITRVTPGLLLGVDTSRLQGTLRYAPQIDVYASHSDENRVSQRFNAQGLATLVPDLFFFDARGAGDVQALTGGFAPGTEASTGRSNQIGTTTAQLTPFLVQRFGGIATARTGYTYQYVDQKRADTDPIRIVGQPEQDTSFTPATFTSHQGFVVVRSGEEFGRLALQGSVSGTTYVGEGIYDGAFRNVGLLETRYSITRAIAALVELGYEEQRFKTVPVTELSEPIWALGVRLTPTEDSSVTAKYGQRNGFASAFLDAAVDLGARTRLVANYSEKLTSSALSAVDLLSATSLDALGNPIDTETGAPVLPSFANSFLSVQSGIFRQRSASAAISQVWSRDTFTLSLTQDRREPVADAPGSTRRGFEQDGISIGLTWAHDLAERTSLTAFGRYGQTTSPTAGDGTVATLGAALAHQLSPGLAGTVSYRFGVSESGGSSDRTVQNIITAGLRQSF